jgi:hypothetical protein
MGQRLGRLLWVQDTSRVRVPVPRPSVKVNGWLNTSISGRMSSLFDKLLMASKTRTEVLQRLGVRVNNGNGATLRMMCRRYDIALPVWDRAAAARGNVNSLKLTTDAVLTVGNRTYNATVLKRALASIGRDTRTCEECGQDEVWNDKPLVLHVDHVNGDRFDNRANNLRVLCPHCHTQTPTYARSNRDASTGRRKEYSYCACGNRMGASSMRCQLCNRKNSRPQRRYPAADAIVAEIEACDSLSTVAERLKVSDAALKKHLKKQGIDVQSLNYRRKHKAKVQHASEAHVDVRLASNQEV